MNTTTTTTTNANVEFEGETYKLEMRRKGNRVTYNIFNSVGEDAFLDDGDKEEKFMDAFDVQRAHSAGIYD